jgi:small subunit ribosomal protein S8
MATTDPIADMLNRMRIASRLRRDAVLVRSSKIVAAIAEALMREGFLAGVEVVPNAETPVQNDLQLKLKYGRTGERTIEEIRRVSKPGRRVYRRRKDLKPVLHGLGVLILSTPKGVMSDREAQKQNVGGEVLCSVS